MKVVIIFLTLIVGTVLSYPKGNFFTFVTHYSKSQIFVQKFNFDKIKQHFHEFFTQIFFDNFFREIKVVNSKKVQNQNIFTIFSPKKIDNFLGKLKLNVWTKMKISNLSNSVSKILEMFEFWREKKFVKISFCSFSEPKNRCFHLSVNDCDCDVNFYCSIICQDEDQGCSYDQSTETCCCLENTKFKNNFCNEP